ncbi:excalibur calcium-binding domain-containing protein [Parasphingorhabdus flavimaris]|uniref:excalibur calcium-binding domain-containing protein n=1 Tax=Parasphingorhabdus flavimaris TaxID=266812 RepID=UPI001C3CA7CC|nr:excalibur calcium-binding domain-containing protein [Parasphingorhabdus flavimaris]
MTARDYYPYCAAARVAGAAPISRGPKDYGRHLDGDVRGIARNKADTAFKIAKKAPPVSRQGHFIHLRFRSELETGADTVAARFQRKDVGVQPG